MAKTGREGLMREIVGFGAGIVAGVAGTVLLGTETGRQLRERLASEAEPEIRSALEEWDPLLREAARAVRLIVRDLEANADRVARYVATMAQEGASDGEVDATSLETRFLASSPDEPGREPTGDPSEEDLEGSGAPAPHDSADGP
jgi:hypothetical protein